MPRAPRRRDGAMEVRRQVLLLAMVTTLCCAPKVILGVLDEPRNVRMSSYNMDMVLHWDQPGNTSQVSYTTEFNTAVTVYRPGCVNISVLSCDFTALDIPLTAYGTYRGRVRAQRGPETTAWVESASLTLDINTTIGPPNVTLVSNGVHMTIHIIDPVFRISNLRDIYNYASYVVTYWREDEEGKKDKAKNMTVQQNPLVLSDLEPLSRYCVKVQIKTVRNLTPSRESRVTCVKTTDQERLPWLEAVVTFFVIAMGVTVAVVVVVYRKKLANFLCPSVLLPPYFKTNLCETPGSLIHMAMGNYCPPVETYDPVDVIPTENNTDEERHLVAEEDHCSARCQTEEEPKQTTCGKGALVPTAEHDITEAELEGCGGEVSDGLKKSTVAV